MLQIIRCNLPIIWQHFMYNQEAKIKLRKDKCANQQKPKAYKLSLPATKPILEAVIVSVSLYRVVCIAFTGERVRCDPRLLLIWIVCQPTFQREEALIQTWRGRYGPCRINK